MSKDQKKKIAKRERRIRKVFGRLGLPIFKKRPNSSGNFNDGAYL